MFEKRKQKGSIRKRNVDDVSNGENEDEIDVISTVALVKKEQENRKRQLDHVATYEIVNKSAKIVESSLQRDIKSMISSQFATVKSGNSVISHEEILEKYIKEKMGTIDETNTSKQKRSEDDELYIVPKEIRDLEGTKTETLNGAGNDEVKEDMAWTTGISEVNLPLNFKMQNIKDTEIAKMKRNEEKKLQNQLLKEMTGKQKTLSIGNSSIFQKEKKNQYKFNNNTSNSDGKEKQHIGNASTGSERIEKSTDHIVFDKFRKFQSRKKNH